MINTSSLFLQICNIIPKEMGSVHLGKIKPVTALLKTELMDSWKPDVSL